MSLCLHRMISHWLAKKQDDGYTGTNFDRPGFKELLLMLEERKADYVIVKDLSRLGRDYIETGKYIECTFPAMGIRFIAVNDCIGSGKKNQADEIVIPFKNLINDSYCRELSNKLRRQYPLRVSEGCGGEYVYAGSGNRRCCADDF